MPKRAKALFVGVDIGGTNTVAAVVDRAGKVLHREKVSTDSQADNDEFVRQTADAVRAAIKGRKLKKRDIAAVGVGAPGVVDTAAGVLVKAPNVPRLRKVPLRAGLETELQLPVYVGNDVNMGTLGEKWRGAAREADDVVGVFVGTGVGGGLVIGGAPYTGYSDVAGEIGHLIMQIDGPLCGCGNRGCLEALASRTAIERDLREAMKAGRRSVLSQLLDEDSTRIRSGLLRQALEQEDELVTEVLTRASRILGLAAMTIRHLVDPEVIVFGGGVIEACGDFMLPLIEQAAHDDPLLVDHPPMAIVRSELGDDAVLLGTVALAMTQGGELSVQAAKRKPAKKASPKYPKVAFIRFGEARVGKKTYDYDLIVDPEGKVRKRKKKLAREEFGTSHKIGARELEAFCDNQLELLVIGTGRHGMVQLDESAVQLLENHGTEYRLLPSSEAAEAYNSARGRKALLLHVTC